MSLFSFSSHPPVDLELGRLGDAFVHFVGMYARLATRGGERAAGMLVVTGPQAHFGFGGYSGLLLMWISALGRKTSLFPWTV